MSKTVRRRGQTSIIMGILEAAKGEGASKTTIVYRIGFNFERVNKYLELMTNKDLIERVQNGTFPLYRITQKGEQALRKLMDADTFIFGGTQAERPQQNENESRVLA